MKRKLFTAIVFIVVAVSCVCGFLSCGGDDSRHFHSFGEYVYNNDATCVIDGSVTVKCKYCNEVKNYSVSGTAKGHALGDYVYNQDATCVDDGTMTAECKYCNKSFTIALSGSATGHNYVNDVCVNCGDALSLDFEEVLDGDEVVGYAVSGIGAIMSTDIVIPSEHNGKPVVSIGEGAFKYKKITSIEIPDSVTSIGESAFLNCNNLTSIRIPGGVESINYRVFCGCSALTSVTIPYGVKSIDRLAFFGCRMTSITIPQSVTSIGLNAFVALADMTIYCEVESKPDGWNEHWYRGTASHAVTIVWDCKNAVAE